MRNETKKIHSRSEGVLLSFSHSLMKLKRTLLSVLAMVVLTSANGCSLFKKSKKPKENPAIAAETEGDFRQRWIEHRTAELIAQGTAADAARQSAATEFRDAFPYIRDGKK